jgi:hypothetical protein
VGAWCWRRCRASLGLLGPACCLEPEKVTKLPPADPWFARLREAYLEPWGSGLPAAFALAIRVGTFAHAVAWARQRDHLPAQERPGFDRTFPIVLRRAVAQTLE